MAARLQLMAVPPNQGGPYGDVVYDESTGRLTITGLAAQVTQRERDRVGNDAEYGRLLVDRGWSNGQLYLVPVDTLGA